MAQQKATGFSSKVLGLRFMQRAAEKRKLEEDAAAQETAVQAAAEAAATPSQLPGGDASWPQPSTSGRCVVTYEPVPLPGFTSRPGRMTFGPGVAKQQKQQGQPQPTAPKEGIPNGAASAASQPSVSDADMARVFRKPAEMRAWQPSSLRIYDQVGAIGPAEAAGGGRTGGGAQAPENVVGSQSANSLRGQKPCGAGSSKGTTQSDANSFAPLRPPKRQKL